MRRFIRYLYEYEQEKKMRNVGFVKVEQDVDQCVIHVHGKGFRMEENAQGLRVYLFWNTEDKCIGIPQGVTEVPGPAVNWQLWCSSTRLPVCCRGSLVVPNRRAGIPSAESC